jgi:hypothetical protein
VLWALRGLFCGRLVVGEALSQYQGRFPVTIASLMVVWVKSQMCSGVWGEMSDGNFLLIAPYQSHIATTSKRYIQPRHESSQNEAKVRRKRPVKRVIVIFWRRAERKQKVGQVKMTRSTMGQRS